MALTRQQKEEVVAEVAGVAASAHSAVAAEYRGITVTDLTGLRAKARSNGVYLRVVKNSGFSQEDPGSAARLFRDFAKENDKLVVTMAAVGGEKLEASQIGKLADLPTRDEGIAMLMSVMQAPIVKLARTLNEVPGKLVRTTEAVRVSKEGS